MTNGRHTDGSAGDVDYARIGHGYRQYRRPEPEFETAILRALGSARRIVNVGAGTGSYEPRDRTVIPVEPSATMRAHRPANLPEAIDATAEDLPFPDKIFDAALTTFSLHQWHDLAGGLRELRRVTLGPIVILTADPTALHHFWLNDYLPEVLDIEASRYPHIDVIAEVLGKISVTNLKIPLHCADGFTEAYYGRPDRFLDPGARAANSAWSFVPQETIDRFSVRLTDELNSGEWDYTYGRFRTMPHFLGSLRLIVSP